MKNNPYEPWNVRTDYVPETESGALEYLLAFAVLAPSSHNTQPWRFRIVDGAIELHYEEARRLTVSDPADRQLYLSLGAALENIVRAAESIGRAVEIGYRLEGDLVAVIKLGADASGGRDFRAAMALRRSTRLPFSPEPVNRRLVDAIQAAPYGGTRARVLEVKAEIETVARINGEASGRMLADPGFRAELSGWVRNNWTKQPDGMPGFVQGIPGPVSLLAPVVVKNTNIGPEQAKKDRAMFLASPAVVVLSGADDKRAWLEAGRTFELICLEAELAGYQVSALGSAIEDARGAEDLTAKLGLKGRPLAVMRVGKAKRAARHSPRRSAAAATDH